jgi:predicted thioredoxin/glutaredoxin
MKIDCYLSEHCGSYYQLRENIHAALQELGLVVEVVFHTVSYDEAVSLGITGSPTIRLDGKDLFEGGSSPGIT